MDEKTNENADGKLPDKGDPEFHTSPHFADCIAEVPTKDGKKPWIICHIEAQGRRGGSNPARRMFFYMCLIRALPQDAGRAHHHGRA